MGIGFEVSGLSGALLLPSGTGTDGGKSVGVGSPVPTGTERLPSVTEIETTADEPVGFLGAPTSTGVVMAIDTSPPPSEIVGSEEAVDRVMTGATDVALVVLWIAYCRRKRTGMVVSLDGATTEPRPPTFGIIDAISNQGGSRHHRREHRGEERSLEQLP